MRLRVAHVACLILLLSTFGVAERSALRVSTSLGSHYVGMLLQQRAAATVSELPFVCGRVDVCAALPAEAIASVRTVWTVRAPSAHTAAVHATTAFGR